jgi:enolase
MSGSRNYKVATDGTTKSQQIPMFTVINGWEAVREKIDCYEMLWMALEFESGDRWVELQSE